MVLNYLVNAGFIFNYIDSTHINILSEKYSPQLKNMNYVKYSNIRVL